MLTKEETARMENELIIGHEYITRGGIYSKQWYIDPIKKVWYLEISPVMNIDGAGKWTWASTENAQVRKPHAKIYTCSVPFHEE